MLIRFHGHFLKCDFYHRWDHPADHQPSFTCLQRHFMAPKQERFALGGKGIGGDTKLHNKNQFAIYKKTPTYHPFSRRLALLGQLA
jgi:hypothetical protein